MRWPTLPCPLQSHSTVRILQFCLWLISWNVRQLHYKYLFQMFQWVICASSFFVFYTGGPGQLPINWSVKTAILCPHSLTGFLSGKPAGSLNVEQYERRSRCQQPGVKILNNRSKGQKGEEGSKRETERELSICLCSCYYTPEKQGEFEEQVLHGTVYLQTVVPFIFITLKSVASFWLYKHSCFADNTRATFKISALGLNFPKKEKQRWFLTPWIKH